MKTKQVLIFFWICNDYVFGQQSAGLEQYYYVRAKQLPEQVLVAHYESPRSWYTEARYNYEDMKTASLYGGKVFKQDGKISWSMIPMGGIVLGNFKGASAGINGKLETGRVFFNVQSQYTRSFSAGANDFYFSWSEAGFQATKKIFVGLSVQHTQLMNSKGGIESGCFTGMTLGNWALSIYSFNPADIRRYFIAGLSWEWQKK